MRVYARNDATHTTENPERTFQKRRVGYELKKCKLAQTDKHRSEERCYSMLVANYL